MVEAQSRHEYTHTHTRRCLTYNPISPLSFSLTLISSGLNPHCLISAHSVNTPVRRMRFSNEQKSCLCPNLEAVQEEDVLHFEGKKMQ